MYRLSIIREHAALACIVTCYIKHTHDLKGFTFFQLMGMLCWIIFSVPRMSQLSLIT